MNHFKINFFSLFFFLGGEEEVETEFFCAGLEPVLDLTL